MQINSKTNSFEQLGSGMPRILKTYDESCFYFTENHIRMTLPKEQVTEQVTEQATEQVTEQTEKLVSVLHEDMTLSELMIKCEIKHRPTFLYNYIQPALELGLIEMTIPDKPKSSNQKYKLTVLGEKYKNRTE